MKEDEIRYDRQLRLWGDEGQHSIAQADICVFGSSALACEILKSLVLAGIRSFLIVDSEVVTNPDLGSNFFIEKTDLMQPRAKIAELNPSVEGKFDLRSAEQYISQNSDSLSEFSVVIASNLLQRTAYKINKYLFIKNIPFIYARSYGLVGFVRISVKEHTVTDCHDENPLPDLRIDEPFEELASFSDEIDLGSLKYDEHSHIPYLILYIKALKVWREKQDQKHAFPDTYEKRKDFEQVYLSLRKPKAEGNLHDEENFSEGRAAIIRSLHKTCTPKKTQELLEHPKAVDPDHSQFWIHVAALRRFVLQHNKLPLSGQLPDMISDTKTYVRLASIFRQKAICDAKEVYRNVCSILNEKGYSQEFFKFNDCKQFCKKASMIRVINGSLIESETNMEYPECLIENIRNSNFSRHHISNVLCIPPVLWYLLIKAVDRFQMEKSRFPGTNGVPCIIDSHDLKQRFSAILQSSQIIDAAEVLEKVPEEVVSEMCRYGNAEIHVIAAFIGGIVAQEAIKLITHQYLPLNNMLIFDGHTQQGSIFSL
ncbi:unnamed protein product [Dracunculus medinensis]|uniref:NEDD8-activating enzyme E1 regulatory subunit n=1 Tax=Dracunculus medinensis TaxID=318479 RepID=A0A0N4U7L3_DRAME|nr:unnamed protein product [Dracunculus medinensis]